MERIKQALERARAERNSKQRNEKHPKPKESTVTDKGAPAETRDDNFAPSNKRQAQLPSGALNYSQTHNIEISKAQMRKNRLITGFEPCEFTNAYKLLRTQVMQRLNENKWNVLAITSPGPGEGKTLTALNLAASIAMEVDSTVLLVDANLRHPSVHEHLGIPDSRGLSHYLTENVPLAELLIHPKGIDHLTVLLGGNSMLNSSEMLNSPRMSQLVEEVKTRYSSRVVIFDLPPVLNAADALAFAPYVDAALLVVEEGKTTRQEIKNAVDLLSGTNVIGTVLNKAEPS